VTTWIENPGGGRKRGPIGLVRAWIAVIIRPKRFFRNGIAPGDQAPGLAFAILVSVIHVATRFAFFPERVPGRESGQPLAWLVLTFVVVAVFVTPVVLHLVAALQTVLLVPLVDDRAGVSKTIQVIAYAAAPCVLSSLSLPILWLSEAAYGPGAGTAADIVGILPAMWLATAVYGAVILVVGIAVVHDTSLPRAAAATALPALFVFGYGFLGIHAFELLVGMF
jgi:hypothetical protein